MFGRFNCFVLTNMSKELMLSIILNTILIDAAHMGHLTHDLIEVKAVSHDEHVRDDKATVIALETVTQRGVLLTENTCLDMRDQIG